MDTYCASVGIPSKFRQNFTNSYYNVPSSCTSRTMRPFGSEYTNRRSPAHNSLWQERLPPRTTTNRSCIGINPSSTTKKSSKGKLCTIALAIASFLVFLAVLAIAGMALYMGALHTDTSNSIINFSCSAKILRGDRFISSLQEKSQKYKRQLELLYRKSILGPALLSCNVEKFGNDTVTIYFKLTFNKRKFTTNISNIERNIKDILLSDALSKKSIFRNVRFDPRSIKVKLIQNDDAYQLLMNNNQNDITKHNNKNGVVLKSNNNNNNSNITTTMIIMEQENLSTKKPVIKDDLNKKESNKPVIHGSFKITKTDADISEKKTETTTIKSRIHEKLTTISSKKTTFKETSITSALYKIAAVEKVPKTTTTTTTTTAIPQTQTTTTSNKVTPTFSINPQIFDEEPWIPILPNLTKNIEFVPTTTTTTTNQLPINKNQPFYTSFTNPGLSYNLFNSETLGSTSLKSHPIPVNKIPITTEPTKFSTTTTTATTTTTTEIVKQPGDYVEIETVKYVPGSTNSGEMKNEQILKNISTIFHTLASSLDNDKINLTDTNLFRSNDDGLTNEEPILGHGQVEVVEGDVEDLMLQTTKLPLVTLIPVKSNSGIGRPLRKRPIKADTNNLSVENRSFPSSTRLNVNDNNNSMKQLNKTNEKNFQIVGILNFATETNVNNQEPTDIVRYPKMEIDKTDNNQSDMVVVAVNSSITSIRNDENKNNKGILNILSPEQIKQLSEISNVHNNGTIFDEPLISDKAISSSYTINHAGLKILTKTYNKLNTYDKTNYNKIDINIKNNTIIECDNNSIKCGDGKCLPNTIKCNQLIDCNDGIDEEKCNCVDYLRSQYLLRKICDGIVDCWDYSDENQCEWCKIDQYVCSNSKVCIDRIKICNGIRDCPQGDDERQCVTIANSLQTAQEFPYYSDGFLMVRKHGEWGKLCTDNFQNVISHSKISWEISDLGKAVCKSMTYQNMDTINIVEETDANVTKYFELTYAIKNETKSGLSFKQTNCPNKHVVKVKCESLECGARPQVAKPIARVVGGGNAGLGAWPWQAALYKEGEFQCGATLLTNRWLVSAGHCFYRSQDEYWVVRLGALRRGTTLPSPYEQLRKIIRILVHPGYVDNGFINDISLLQMEYPVVFSDYVRPVCLPQLNQLPQDDTLCTVIGWGQLFEVGRIFPDTLQEVQVPIISTSECRKRTLFLPLYRITDDMFCAGYERGGRDACLGDSGGPLMCPEANGRWTLHGITSNGYGCARANRPGVYTKVGNYLNWIHNTMNNYEHIKNFNNTKNYCAGHRCPLGECLPESRLCNGFIECSDGSDEKNC